jgi:hypothetical protein
MNDLRLIHLVTDLKHRLRRLQSFLEGRTPTLPAIAASHAKRLLARVDRALATAEALLVEPNLGHPTLGRHYFYDYKRLAEFTQQFEEWPAMVLERFSPADETMSSVVARICKEVGYPHSPPLCASVSLQYFAAIPSHDLVAAPATVGNDLLSWPDIYHEMGHFLLARHEAQLARPIRNSIDKHYAAAIADAKLRSWPAGAIEELERLRTLWSGSWVLEFGSDMLATLLCGPAFGHSNVRLSAVVSHDVFAWSASHPADDARSTAICKMLRAMALAPEATHVDRQWAALVSLCGDTRPQTYGLAFPQGLLDEVVRVTKGGATSLGLRTYRAGAGSIAEVLNSAWEEFARDPEGFDTWQRSHLTELLS